MGVSVVSTAGLMELRQIERFAFHRGELRLLVRIQHTNRFGKFFLAKIMHRAEPVAAISPVSCVSRLGEFLGIFPAHGGELALLDLSQTEFADNVGIPESARAGSLNGDLPQAGLLGSFKDFGQLWTEFLVHVFGNLGELGSQLGESRLTVFTGRIPLSGMASARRLELLRPFGTCFGNQLFHLIDLFRSESECLLNRLLFENK